MNLLPNREPGLCSEAEPCENTKSYRMSMASYKSDILNPLLQEDSHEKHKYREYFSPGSIDCTAVTLSPASITVLVAALQSVATSRDTPSRDSLRYGNAGNRHPPLKDIDRMRFPPSFPLIWV